MGEEGLLLGPHSEAFCALLPSANVEGQMWEGRCEMGGVRCLLPSANVEGQM